MVNKKLEKKMLMAARQVYDAFIIFSLTRDYIEKVWKGYQSLQQKIIYEDSDNNNPSTPGTCKNMEKIRNIQP